MEFLIAHEADSASYGLNLGLLTLADDDYGEDMQVWWDVGGYEAIIDYDLSAKVFDTVMSIGAARAHRQLQIAINRLSDKPIAVDGKLSTITLEKCNVLMRENDNLLSEFRECIAHYFRNLVADNPQYRSYLDSWLKRAYD